MEIGSSGDQLGVGLWLTDNPSGCDNISNVDGLVQNYPKGLGDTKAPPKIMGFGNVHRPITAGSDWPRLV